jgi:carboxypeptidase C (cathepsin A)
MRGEIEMSAEEETPPAESPSGSPSPENHEGKLKATLELAIPALKSADLAAKDAEKPPVVTHHTIDLNGKPLRYTVTTGLMPLRNDGGEVEASIFFMAYTRDDAGPVADRPLMFSFNGGPGSASVWLHLGALGPKRVRMREDGAMPPPPFRLEENPHTWLDRTDLVFIDPVGTGYSRPAKPESGQKFWGLKGDIASVGEFIRSYLTRYARWSSPLFLVGESYGTTRAAGLAGHLIDQGIAFNGILLVSSILQFQTALFRPGNDLPYVLFLPTYTATAWYHRRLPADLQGDLGATLAEVEGWALGPYAAALAKGDALIAEERQEVVARLARYTGLAESFVANCDLRIEIQRFCKELLRDERRTVGRLDSRFKGIDSTAAGENPDFDPSMAAIRPPYTAAFNDYVRTQLGYETDRPYHILGSGIKTPWQWDSDNRYAETGEALRDAMARNPHMKLFVASGYYDLATPYFATEYTLAHLSLDPTLRANVTTAEYEAGHMMYIDVRELARLKSDVAAFLDTAIQSEDE